MTGEWLAMRIWLPAVLMAALAACNTGVVQPTVHEVHINPSADQAADVKVIDEVATGLGFQAQPQHRAVGKKGQMPCVGNIEVLQSYRYTDAVGFYVVKFQQGGLLSVAFADTAEPGKETPEASHELFVKLAKGLIARFGKDRTSVPPMESDCVNWNGVNVDTSGEKTW